MKNTQHTPAPWVSIGSEATGFTVSAQGKLNDGRICDLYCGSNEAIKVDEFEANARLIAAAPELLASLQAFKSAYRQMQREEDGEIFMVGSRQLFLDCFPNMEAAIAKATGAA